MIHHVALETRLADVEACVAFYGLLGFVRVPVPESLRDVAEWVERDGQQLHFLYTDEPVVPRQGHVAVVRADYEETVERLRAGGFAPQPGREHWGSPRCSLRDPAGHRVEVMRFPPG